MAQSISELTAEISKAFDELSANYRDLDKALRSVRQQSARRRREIDELTVALSLCEQERARSLCERPNVSRWIKAAERNLKAPAPDETGEGVLLTLVALQEAATA